ncbi:MAG: RNA-binding domain-containing protein [bacterium]
MSDNQDIQTKLQELLALPYETEWVEFKEAKNNFDFDDLGKYFSALSNEANLNIQPAGWLVFGVTNKPPRHVVGTNYRCQQPGLERLKNEIAQYTNHRTTFRVIHEPIVEGGRVVVFEIPAATRGIPTTWNGIAYGRIHESLMPLSLDKIERIRRQATYEDWSVKICQGASVSDLDSEAITFARQQYINKNPKLRVEVEQWDNLTFLQKTRICISRQITRTAIILLGKSEAANFLSPATARISWVLMNEKGQPTDYAHFGPPFILAVDKVYSKIRNNAYRYMPDTTLFPIEITQYDSWVIREALHNAIAHQDYTKGGHINMVEEPDSLLFANLGEFLPGSIEEVIRQDSPPEVYRNRLLTEAMVSFNMIDTIGSGIKRMFQKQRDRFFPLPDYDFNDVGRVKVRILGKIVNEYYTRVLIEKTDLNLWDVITLDKVQKGNPLTKEEFKLLKGKKLIEGRRPNIYVSAKIAAVTETKTDYIRKRTFDKQHYIKMVNDYLAEFKTVQRTDINRLLLDKISDALSPEQKRNFITNLLQEMRRNKMIQPVKGKRGKGARWELYKPSSKR